MKKIVLVLILFSIGCATQKVSVDSASNNGMSILEGKVAILLPEKSHQLSFEYFSHPTELTARLELRAMLGIPAATLWLNNSKFTLLNHLRKEAFLGDSTKKGLKAWTNIDLDPNVFFLVMNDKVPAGWSCSRNQSQWLENCSTSTTRVQFERLSESRKRVILRAEAVEIRFIVELPATYKPLDSKVFLPVSPRDYKIFTQP